MGNEQTAKMIKVALASGSLLIIGVGLYFALGGEWYGWAIAAFGALDLATIPFVVRIIGARRSDAGPAPASTPEPDDRSPSPEPGGQPDPSYNPYARED